MTLASGTRLGAYEIVEPIGAGGMGEVYRARDTRLDRIVAIKIMPALLAHDPVLRERFEREAHAISQLNHPNICTLHDVGSDQGVDFLVMEYLEGNTLEQHISRGPVPLASALHIAMQVADGLERAHHAGIVHRDLKPSNIFLVRSGGASSAPLVKLLDFGLAKSGSPVASGDTASPTLAQALTGQGTILGTLQYMAPEQLEGREVDTRADIFAFGAVLYEIVTGRRAFDGKSQASVIASVLSADPPPVSAHAPVAPAVLDHVVERALAKDRTERWESMHDILLHLRWIAAHGLAPVADTGGRTTARRERRWWAAISAALLVAVLSGVGLLWRPRAETPPLVHFEIPPPEGAMFVNSGSGVRNMTPVLSHDGSGIIVPAVDANGVRRLWLRRLDGVELQLLEGTENAFLPFWSPDDRSIAFFADGKLKRLDLSAGGARPLCDAPSGLGGSWNADGVIVFAPTTDAPLQRVLASGGTPVQVTTLNAASKHASHGFPDFLPDGRHFLYLARSVTPSQSAVILGSLDSAESTAVLSTHQRAEFVQPRWVVHQGQGGPTLFAQPFDFDRVQTSGEPIALRQNVVVDGETGQAVYSFSDRGTFAYHSPLVNRRDTLTWYTRAGRVEGTVGEPGAYAVPRLSKDGRRIAVSVGGSIWVRDLVRGTFSRVTEGPNHCCPVWAPDGMQIGFRKGSQDLAVTSASGTGPETVILATGASNVPTQWAPDGRSIVFQTIGAGRTDTMLLPLAEPRTPTTLLQSPANEEQAQISPDGRWLAFTSDESGRPEVYVQNFPALSQKWPVSTTGGADPQWRSDGAELFFIGADRKLMAVAIRRAATFEPGIPTALFQTRVSGLTDVRTHYQVSADGQRFLVNTLGQGERGSPVQVLVNWHETIRQ